MVRKDFIERELAKHAVALARLMNKMQNFEYDELRLDIDEALTGVALYTANQLRDIDAELMFDDLVSNQKLSHQRISFVAELLYFRTQTAVEMHEDKAVIAAFAYKTMLLLQHVERQETVIFSVERRTKIIRMKRLLL